MSGRSASRGDARNAPKANDARKGSGTDDPGWAMPLTASRKALLPDGTDRDLRRLVYGIFTMSVRFDRLRERMAEALGLSGIQYHILMVVAERGQGEAVTVSTVAETLHASGAYVTTETGKLVARGLLEKRPNPDDGRSVVLSLTGAGRQAVDGFADMVREVNDTLFDGIGPENFHQFCMLIDHMAGTTERAVDLIDRRAKDRRAGTGAAGDAAALAAAVGK